MANQDAGLFIKLPNGLKTHVRKYVNNKKKFPEGVSGLVRSLLAKETKYEDK